MDNLEKHFIEGIKPQDSSVDILNWYRNLYYKEAENTERRIVAEAINNLFISLNVSKTKQR